MVSDGAAFSMLPLHVASCGGRPIISARSSLVILSVAKGCVRKEYDNHIQANKELEPRQEKHMLKKGVDAFDIDNLDVPTFNMSCWRDSLRPSLSLYSTSNRA